MNWDWEEETRRELLQKTDNAMRNFIAKEVENKRLERAAYAELEAGRVYKVTDEKISPLGTSPRLQLFSTNKTNVLNSNPIPLANGTDIPSNADEELQKMRERVGVAAKKSPVDQEDLERIIYEARDEWCSDTGEWDASKMPVPELASRLADKLGRPEGSPW